VEAAFLPRSKAEATTPAHSSDEPANPAPVQRLTVSACADGTIAARLSDLASAQAPAAVGARPRDTEMRPPEPTAASRCDISDAIAFALRHAAQKAEARRILLVPTVDPDVAAACDRQIGRRIVSHLLETLLTASRPTATIHVLARRLKGVVLIRAQCEAAAEESGSCEGSPVEENIATMEGMVEEAGGTLIVDRQSGGLVMSIRLDLAFPAGSGSIQSCLS
jgi:hypothetical protein